jgi:hypothetical protein
MGSSGSPLERARRGISLKLPAHDNRLDEWTECRTTIGRCDNTLADIRKYGFTLVTLLLTANALITPKDVLVDHVAASSVVITLVVVLFVMDRYWWALLKGATRRASQLEPDLNIKITGQLTEASHEVHNTSIATLVYFIFVGLACGVALVTLVPAGAWLGTGIMLCIGALALGIIFGLHRWFAGELQEVIEKGLEAGL